MFKVSQLISLPVINVYSLKIEGNIENAYFDKTSKLLKYFKVYNEQEDSYKSVQFNNILKITNSAIYIKNSSQITLYENDEYNYNNLANPINSKVYIIYDNYIGNLTDITIAKNGKLINIIINNKDTFNLQQVVGINSDLTLISPNKKININNFKPKAKKTTFNTINSEPVVNILKTTNTSPNQGIANYQFLLNRQILKDIKNPNGEIIAHKNTLVTQNILNKLKHYGKLKELTLNIK